MTRMHCQMRRGTLISWSGQTDFVLYNRISYGGSIKLNCRFDGFFLQSLQICSKPCLSQLHSARLSLLQMHVYIVKMGQQKTTKTGSLKWAIASAWWFPIFNPAVSVFTPLKYSLLSVASSTAFPTRRCHQDKQYTSFQRTLIFLASRANNLSMEIETFYCIQTFVFGVY